MTIQNNIEREMILKADIAVVWDAITNPKQLSQWFGDQADIPTLAEGEPIIFGWDDDICKGVIQTVDEPKVFAFRWQSSRLGKTEDFQEEYATLVTFTLTSVPTGTHLHLIETGFASLPDTIIDKVAVPSADSKVPFTPQENQQPQAILANPVQDRVDNPELSMGSGEVKLPHNKQAYEDNVSGWTHELNDLKTFIEQGV